MKKEDFSDNIELVKQDQLSVSNNDLDAITVVDSSPRNVNVVVNDPNDDIPTSTFADTLFEVCAILFAIVLLFITFGYIAVFIVYAIGYFQKDYTLFITYDCINIISPCFLIGGIGVFLVFVIFYSLYFTYQYYHKVETICQ